MKHLKIFTIAFLAVSFLISCSDSSKVKVSDTGKLLIAHDWKLQTNELLDVSADSLQDVTGVDAQVKLDDDIRNFIDFIAETLSFDYDGKDDTKLAYSSTFGEGLFSIETLGWWTISDDDSELTLFEWDSSTGKQKDSVIYKIKDISDEKLILEGPDGGTKIYNAK